MNKIIPGILEKDEAELFKKISYLKNRVDKIHIDVIDEEYGRGLALLPQDFSIFSCFKIIGIHLMVGSPIVWLDKIKKIDNCLAYGQVEKINNQEEFIKKSLRLGIIPGVAIDLESSVDILNQDCFLSFKSFLLMSVKAGYSGQTFDDRVFDKYKQLRQLLGNNAEILVDGGIDLEKAGKCSQIGFDGLVVNSFLWNNFNENFKKLENF